MDSGQEGVFFAKYSKLPDQTGLAGNGMLVLAAHELGDRHLVHDRVRVPYAGGDLFPGLVPAARDVGRPALFPHLGGRRRFRNH